MHLVEDTTEAHAKDNGKDIDAGEVGRAKGIDNVGRDELRKDTIIDSVTQRDIIARTARGYDKGARNIIHDEINVVFTAIVRGTGQIAVGSFRQVGSCRITFKGNILGTHFVKHFSFVLALHDDGRQNTKQTGEYCRQEVEANRFVSDC